MVVDLQIQYSVQGNNHAGRLITVNPDGCVIEGGAKAEIGEILFLSFQKRISLGGFKGKVVGQTFQKHGWTMGMYFVDLSKEEKAMLFDRIAYFSFLQEKLRKKLEEETVEEGRL